MKVNKELVLNSEQQQIVDGYLTNTENFITTARAVLEKTYNADERTRRQENFDLLLKACTCYAPDEFQRYMRQLLPANNQDTALQKIRNKLIEINNFCQDAFKDDHQFYRLLCGVNTTQETQGDQKIKDDFRDQLKDTIANCVNYPSSAQNSFKM